MALERGGLLALVDLGRPRICKFYKSKGEHFVFLVRRLGEGPPSVVQGLEAKVRFRETMEGTWLC